jgi:N-methylhydantoinase B
MKTSRPTVDLGSAIDPITFEVIRHRLWQINDEQGIAIKTISASPIVVEGNDFNVGLFTADGQIATNGTGSLVHVATMGSALQSVMKLAGHIRDGDAYLTNDPFLGALHQNDVIVVAPLFWEGEIIMWVGNVLHHPDVGGIDEGSFCINARNLFQDPPRYFLKLVDQGELVTEVERTFRAQIGAIHAAKARLYELLRDCGSETVRTVMFQSIDLAEKQIRDRIVTLPEGRWCGEAYMDGERVGSDKIHKVQLSLSREGDTLHFDYTGSSPQVDAAVNCTYHACLAGTTVPLYTFLCQGDIDWNEGLKRCIKLTAPEGTVVNARFPAPVSICTVGFRWLVTVAAAQAVAKMLGAPRCWGRQPLTATGSAHHGMFLAIATMYSARLLMVSEWGRFCPTTGAGVLQRARSMTGLAMPARSPRIPATSATWSRRNGSCRSSIYSAGSLLIPVGRGCIGEA